MGGGVGSGLGGVRGVGLGGQGRCEPRSEVFEKIQKKIGVGVVRSEEGGLGWGLRVEVNEEMKFL